MTLEEALREVEADAGSTADELRRAYLRKLRTRKPESDPVGFMRLRQAYELARSTLRGTPTSCHEGPGTGAPQATPSRFQFDWEDFEAFLALGAYVDAAVVLRASLVEASMLGAEAGLPVKESLDLMLELHSRNELDEARALQRAFRQWLDASGNERALLSDHDAHVWGLVRELGELPADMPRGLRAAIARALRRGTPQQAIGLFERYEGRNERRRVAGLLREHSRSLAALYGPALERPPPSRWAFGGFSWKTFALTIALGVPLCIAAGTTSVRPPPRPSPARELASLRSQASFVLDLDAGACATIRGSLDELASALEQDSCRSARRAVAEALATLGRLERTTGDRCERPTKRLIDLHDSLDRACTDREGSP